MFIALVAPLVAPVVDTRLASGAPIGGAQALLADLAGGLAGRGHRVVLLAPIGSRVPNVEVVDLGIDASAMVPARFLDDRAQGAPLARPDLAAQRAAFAHVRVWLDSHLTAGAVVHAHAYDAPAFDALTGLGAAVVHTLHLPPLDPTVVDAARSAVTRGATLVAVSATARALWTARGIRITEVIPNGLDIESIPLHTNPGRHAVFVGRMAPEKGPDVAVRVAAAADVPLVLAGDAYDPAFFAEQILPQVRRGGLTDIAGLEPGEALYLGPLRRPEAQALMGGASATLLPVRWEEPFGLVAAESQAAGTPVAAYRRGALPEVVAEGRGGSLAAPDDEADLARALREARDLDRRGCRAWAVSQFGLASMLGRYERHYALAGARP